MPIDDKNFDSAHFNLIRIGSFCLQVFPHHHGLHARPYFPNLRFFLTAPGQAWSTSWGGVTPAMTRAQVPTKHPPWENATARGRKLCPEQKGNVIFVEMDCKWKLLPFSWKSWKIRRALGGADDRIQVQMFRNKRETILKKHKISGKLIQVCPGHCLLLATVWK